MNWVRIFGPQLWCSDCQARVLSIGIEQFCECNDNEIKEKDECICIPDEPNLMCESCF